MENILTISRLNKQFGSVRAISDMSFEVGKGQVFGLLGPNGSGKTTTLAVILGVIRQSSGGYEWFGNKDSAANRRRIGSILEQPNFYPWLSSEVNLKITCAIRGIPFSAIEEPLNITGMWKYRKNPVREYSLGMKQRLGLAATLLGNPDVLVLDEPTNGIDAKGMIDIRNIILNYADSGKTIILASHILSEVEKICSHVAVLRKGAVIATGEIASVLKPDDHIEVSAEDMDALATVLSSFPGASDVRRAGDVFHVNIDQDIRAGELNRFLTEHGIFADHLSRKKQSLENYFIELLEKDK